MIATQVARIIAHFMVFLNLTDEDLLDLDASVDAMQDLADGLESLDRPFLRELVDAFPVVALEFSGEAQQVVRDIAHSFYLEEELASDDPVRLAELEALRDARG